MSVAYISHLDMHLHEMGAGHPESPKRLDAIHDALIEERIWDFLVQVEAPPGSRELALLVHDSQYVKMVESLSPKEEEHVHLDSDTILNRHSLKAAYRALGAVTKGVDIIMQGESRQVFCAVRPPGHHAERDRSMGFCIFNNIAVAAAYARWKYGLKKIAIVDFDVHFGNGTENIFLHDDDILLLNSFQFPHYPGKRYSTEEEHIINVPLPALANGKMWREEIDLNYRRALQEHRPELILVSAGFDAHLHDPLSDLAFSEMDYEWIGGLLRDSADRICQGRMLAALEGGYNLPALGKSVAAFIRGIGKLG